MSGISSGVGLISGINSSSIIEQLIAVESRPKTLIQRRVTQLQQQQAGVLDLTSRLSALKTAAEKFNSLKIFKAASAQSSNKDVLDASASNGAAPGSYTFLVDRTVSTQQRLSRGYSDRATTSLGATSITVESYRSRLDADTELSQINGGLGLSRGKIVITDRAGTSATVDLTRVSTMKEVLEAINNNGTAKVSASVSSGKLVLTDTSSGVGNLVVRSDAGYTTAESLKINGSVASSTLTGQDIYVIGDGTTIASLRDGAGVRFNKAGGNGSYDFTITTRDGGTYNIDISDLYNGTGGVKSSGPVATVEQLKQRIASQTSNKVSLAVRSDGRGFELTDSTTGGGTFSVADYSGVGAADDLGIVGSTTGATITGQTVLAGLNSTLSANLNAGSGPRSGALTITRGSTTFNWTDIDITGSVNDIFDQISTRSSGRFTASLSSDGRSVVLKDNAATGDPLIVSGDLAGTGGLNIETDPGGVSGSTVTGTRISRQYVELSTQLSQLNGGTGVGTGTIDLIGANGVRASINVANDTTTVSDFLKLVNDQTGSTGLIARINDTGSGIVIEEQSPGAGGSKISVSDKTGTVAKSLFLAGTATETGLNNRIDGTQRRTITLDAGDTLDGILTKVNAAKAGISASVITDGLSSTPYRLQLTSSRSGYEGRLLIDSAGADLGLTSISEGNNSRVFFGSTDPAKGVLLSRTTNTYDGVLEGVRIDAKSSSNTPVTVTVSQDAAAIETAVQEFVTAYNALNSRIAQLTDYDQESNTKGALLGDGTINTLGLELSRVIGGTAKNITGQFNYLAQVGVTVTKNGQLELNTSKLRQALTTDPQGVADVFAAKVAADRPTNKQVLDGVEGITTINTDPVTYTSQGVAERLASLADKYLATVGGTLTGKRNSIDEQVRRNNDRISAMDKLLAAKRSVLERQFASLEDTLAKLQQQQSSISRISSSIKTS